MDQLDWQSSFAILRSHGMRLDRGLSSEELAAVEEFCGCALPPDLRAFLSTHHPVGSKFPAWRNLGSPELAEQLAWPFQGIKFDIEHNDFWWPSWGPRPTQLHEAFEIARNHIEAAPRLIPVYGHRFLPSQPRQIGNPVFSVYQTDIIPYGSNLRSYIETEFGGKEYRASVEGNLRRITFWTDIVEWNALKAS